MPDHVDDPHAANQTSWYLVHCVDCDKPLKAQGTPPEKPICLHCDIIRAAPEAMRELIRKTLQPIPDGEATPGPELPQPEAPAQSVLGG
jgi:hypothetical protein